MSRYQPGKILPEADLNPLQAGELTSWINILYGLLHITYPCGGVEFARLFSTISGEDNKVRADQCYRLLKTSI